MASSPHLFELYLTPLDSLRFKAIVTASTLGSDAESESALPFWDGEQDWRTTVIKGLESSGGFKSEHFPQLGEQDWMKRAGILSAGHPSFAPDYLARIGQALFQALLPPNQPVGQAFQSALRQAENASATLHLRLKFAADAAKRSRLADYPWELIHDGTRFLLNRRVQLSRYIAYDAVPPRQPLGDRLRVLLVSPRARDVGHLSDGEPQAIQTGIAKAESVSLEKLPTPTWRGLSAYLTESATPPQVVHFDGHGIFGKRCQVCGHLQASTKAETCQRCGAPLPEAQGFLAFEDEQGKAEFVSARRLAALVADQGIALVVLSACQSGMAVTGKSVFNGTAQQLIDAQIPAVVAMQYSVQVRAAQDFAEQFYRVLGRGQSALAAVQAGRTWMDPEGNQWYRPVLYLRWQENHHGELFVKPEPQPSAPPKPEAARSRPQPLGLAAQLELQDLQAQLVQLQAEYQACQEAARSTLDPDSKIKLQTKGQKILADISRIGERIEALQSGSGA
ncbi:CHAT domain-containing protein [Leptolyngbya sp. PCC 6406]|uniref:CHAT domain-containing protein n=1 Tax=Leptolyngbya sp. PCC 6406 TaxID=1173264 RepID=UPI0002ABB801|nr:CHAT domain-containing protein [Leptolyngbya sp. PCC 6406]